MPYLINALRGFLMGSADVVPGVSGGTVALVLGIYERVVGSIHAGSAAAALAARGRVADSRRRLGDVEWGLLVPLLVGILLAVVTLASVIERLLRDEPQATAAAFFGLVSASILVAWRLVGEWTGRRLVLGAFAAAGAFLLLGLRTDTVTDPAPTLFFAAGAVAIVAMILPGVSGSFILLMLGMYQAVLAAVNERALATLGVFLAGALLGLGVFSTVLGRLLDRHHDTAVAVLIGLMAGSLRVLWPWPDGTDTARLAAPVDWGVPLIVAAAGFVAVLLVSRLGRGGSRLEARGPTTDD